MRKILPYLAAFVLVVVMNIPAAVGADKPDLSKLVGKIQDHYVRLDAALSTSEIHLRARREVTQPEDEAKTSFTDYLTRRQPKLMRTFAVKLRSDKTAAWNSNDPDWSVIQAIWDARISPDAAMELTRMPTDIEPARLANPADAMEVSLMVFQKITWPEAHRYDAPIHDCAASFRGFVISKMLPLAEFLNSPTTKLKLGAQVIVDGVQCDLIEASDNSGKYQFWVDESGALRKSALYVSAMDDYFGKPFWKATAQPDPQNKADEPDESQRAAYLRNTVTFSDFREIAPGIFLPHTQSVEMEVQRADDVRNVENSQFTIQSVVIRRQPFTEAEMALNVPDGTRVFLYPAEDQTQREWRDGKVVEK